jgi:hypothetical protein
VRPLERMALCTAASSVFARVSLVLPNVGSLAVPSIGVNLDGVVSRHRHRDHLEILRRRRENSSWWPPAPPHFGGDRNHIETCAGCIVSLTTPTRSSFSASRCVSSRSLAEKASRVFLASYFLW